MALIGKNEMIEALARLGERALQRGEAVEIIVLGGSAMMLALDARPSTRDVDVVLLSPEPAKLRETASVVAAEKGWPADWLNDAAKGYLVGQSDGPMIFSAPGIHARRPSF